LNTLFNHKLSTGQTERISIALHALGHHLKTSPNIIFHKIFYNSTWNNGIWFVPNIFRLYVNLASTTSVGAAIGVKEAVNFALIAAESIPSSSGRLFIVIFVSLFFVCFVLIARWLLSFIVRARMQT